MANEKARIKEVFQLHKEGKTDEAKPLYYKLIDDIPQDIRLYGNLGAILRSEGESEKCAQLMIKGLNNCKRDVPELLNTLGNCLRDMGRFAEAYSCYKRALKVNNNYLDSEVSSYLCLKSMNKKSIAKLYLAFLLKKYGDSNKDIFALILSHEIEEASDESRDLKHFFLTWLQGFDERSEKNNSLETEELPAHWFNAAIGCASNGKTTDARKFYNYGEESILKYLERGNHKMSREEVIRFKTVSSWNLGCLLLKHGDFELGWKLYDYGLMTPAPEPQRWQRSLYKPFSSTKVPMWKGQALKDKKLLLLGEQGIGDSMMFLTVLPMLAEEGAIVTVTLPERLANIYNRSYPKCRFVSDKEFKTIATQFEDYDYQCPLGSILQYRLKSVGAFRKHCKSYLKAREENVRSLRKKYSSNGKPLLGISWQGGGKGKRINDKSIPIDEFLKNINLKGFNVLSLQYGNDDKLISKMNKRHNLDIIDDDEIQALKDMESWLDQVDACDLILSIANTTIHGAGGLAKPTLCMLGDKPDWRWLSDQDETHSYWYPTVKIEKKDKITGWEKPYENANKWLESMKRKLPVDDGGA